MNKNQNQYYLFYSGNYCVNSQEFINEITRQPQLYQKFKMYNVDDINIRKNLPPNITAVPTIIVPPSFNPLTGDKAFWWLNTFAQTFLNQQNQGQQQGGMQQPGMGMQQPGMGMQQPDMGMQQGGMGMQQPGMGMQQPGMGMQQGGMEDNFEDKINQPVQARDYNPNDIQIPQNGGQQGGMQQPGMGMQQPGMGMQQPGMGMQQPGGMTQQQFMQNIKNQYKQQSSQVNLPRSGIAQNTSQMIDSQNPFMGSHVNPLDGDDGNFCSLNENGVHTNQVGNDGNFSSINATQHIPTNQENNQSSRGSDIDKQMKMFQEQRQNEFQPIQRT